MNKNDLIASVASSAGLSKSDATRSIESFLDLNNFTKMSLILFMILGKIEIIAVIYLIKRFIFRV